MTFFEDKRNRMLLALFLTASGLLELIFFGYAMEGLYSPLYAVLIDLAAAAALPPLAEFLDFRRKAGPLFIGLGCFVCGFFASACHSWFGIEDIEEGIASFGTGSFWLGVLRYAVLCFGAVFGCALLKRKDWEKGMRLMPAVCAAAAFAFALISGDGILYALFLAACAALAALLYRPVKGEDLHLKIPFAALMAVCFAAACWMLYAYHGAELLTEEAACGFDLLAILAGMGMAFFRYRYGAYLYFFFSLRLCLAYAGGVLRGDVDTWYLFGMLPSALMAGAGALALLKGDRGAPAGRELPETKLRTEPQKASESSKFDD